MRRFLRDDVPVDTCLSIIKGEDVSAASDAACVLACTLRDAGNNIDACRILYSAHARDEGNARVTLAFVDALQSIGAGEAALRTYASLGVKQIQLDSLGHLITPWAASSGFPLAGVPAARPEGRSERAASVKIKWKIKCS